MSHASATITRRGFLATAGAAAASVAVAAPLTHAVAAEDAAADPCVPSFLVKPEPITEFAETHEFDVVVVGAGESGLSAAATPRLRAAVRLPWCRTSTPRSPRATWRPRSTSIRPTRRVSRIVAFMLEKNAYRSNRKLA